MLFGSNYNAGFKEKKHATIKWPSEFSKQKKECSIPQINTTLKEI